MPTLTHFYSTASLGVPPQLDDQTDSEHRAHRKGTNVRLKRGELSGELCGHSSVFYAKGRAEKLPEQVKCMISVIS